MNRQTKTLTIGALAQATGAAVQTLRYYEREGLLPLVARGPSGYRQYSPEMVRRMRFIQQAKALGFTLNEIRDLLALRVSPKTTCAQVRRQAEKKIADIENRMTQLARIKQVLIDLANGCSGRGPVTECPILDALENKEL